MVKITSLTSGQDERRVRAVVDSPTGSITIYEPNKDDIAKIIDLQDFLVSLNSDSNDIKEEQLEISGNVVMRQLIPMLTDIELDENISDEELQAIIDNPTIALLEVKNILSNIVTSVYKMLISSIANEIIQAQLQADGAQISQAISTMAHNITLKDESNEVANAINEITSFKKQSKDTAKKKEKTLSIDEKMRQKYLGDKFEHLKED